MPHWLRLAPAMFLLAWGGNHFTPLLHVYETDGGYEPWAANLLLGVYVAGLIPGLLVGAAISDRYGRRPVLFVGAVGAVAGSVFLCLGPGVFGLLLVGRALAGVGVGVAMSVGTTWMKELSSPPFDERAGFTSGARRSSLTLTLGFGLGAAVTGILAQWAPAPMVTPFAVHGGLALVALAALMTVPESLPAGARRAGAWWRDLRIPSARDRRFTRLILPAAPWVFAAAGVAYAIMPAIVQHELGGWNTLYATVLTVTTLGTGAVVQTAVARLDRWTRGRALAVGLALMTLGLTLSVVAAIVVSPLLMLLVAALLGAAYGVTVMAGLLHIQAMATHRDLAGLTGLYYALTYLGFTLPTVLAALLPLVPYRVTLAVVAALCALCLAQVARELRPRAG